ncbi:PaaX family transcriptional regulator C-terminal domain-containing protein [Leucobacter luti]|uniref:PaaX family transcriptional regulator n=1 Tax=Leucobacter luti TaxID=340320 RepID=A0A4R6S8D0_9MICO|nr:PaaX family transcriptional regulator C-terminal domain-containing protein [Leucobacter luti]MCW2288687.1 phenylacetic acid degradation operon negative regulatory protein [Leucobacter luti]QYM75391.1 PaaX family transcriptional regulator [Leucobacter luti]TCK45158.1 PaaX family transcriptional regulator [Leucobacter luti]TDP95683.1 PaaX family transcriptional regulator [Leucobacter luti]
MTPNTSRTLLVTLLGAFARRTDAWMPIKGIVTLLEELGIDESSTRTGVSRLKKRDWLTPEKRDGRSGYRLTDLAQHTLAAGDEYIWHSRQPANLADGWCIATFSIPEDQRAKRHLLRSRLASLGFGNVGQGVWIAPARMATDALALIDHLELTDNTNLFVGRHAGGQDLSGMARESWDLAGIDAGYRAFIARHQAGFTALQRMSDEELSPRDGFVHYLRALDDWRILPMRDPGLPRELLRSDWAGDPATALIEDIVKRLDRHAFAFVEETLGA